MLRTTFVLVLTLGTLGAARADRILEPVETSFEIPLALAALPARGVGDVNFKTCDKCASYSRLFTSSTRFFVGSREVAAAYFVAAAGDIRKAEVRNQGSLLALYVDKTTLHVNRATISRP